MKKNSLILAAVLFVTFAGGFYTGTLTGKKNDDSSAPSNLAKVSPSASQPAEKAVPDWEEESSKVLIGYVQDFRDPKQTDYSKLTHVIFSFVHPTKEGSVLFTGDYALNNLRATVKYAHKHGTKVILAIGGWYHAQGGESYGYFKDALADPGTSKKLAAELVRLVDQEHLDGIDIDFEHPRNETDARSLLSFTKELSNQLHPKGKELSVAVSAKVHSVTGTELHSVVIDPAMFSYVDHVNIMAYDGQWDGGYNAANLSPYSYTENIVNYWTSLFETHNLPKEKLVLGVPFYAQPEDPAIKQVSYEAIIHNNPQNAGSDIVKMNGTTYHYNGDKTMQRKTKLALENGFGGMMLWEAGHDAEGQYSLTGTIMEVLENFSQNKANM